MIPFGWEHEQGESRRTFNIGQEFLIRREWTNILFPPLDKRKSTLSPYCCCSSIDIPRVVWCEDSHFTFQLAEVTF
jgi:hypothetical protein